MNKKQLSERDVCTKFITLALRQAGWNEMTQLREEVSFTKGARRLPRTNTGKNSPGRASLDSQERQEGVR
jgi:type I site-specific restriction endonuclease